MTNRPLGHLIPSAEGNRVVTASPDEYRARVEAVRKKRLTRAGRIELTELILRWLEIEPPTWDDERFREGYLLAHNEILTFLENRVSCFAEEE